MRTIIKLFVLIITLSFIGCWNMYNDAIDDMENDYKFFLAVISYSGQLVKTYSFNSDNKINESSEKTTTPDLNNPTFGAVHPSGNYLYVPNHGSWFEKGSNGTGNTLSMFLVNDDGSLSPLGTPTNTITTGTGPFAVKVHPSGKFVYVTNDGSDDISKYQVRSDGTLEANGTPTTAGMDPKGLAIDPTGRYLYVANYGSSSISMYRLDNGLLTELSLSPLSTGAGNPPWDIIVHPNGNYVYSTTGAPGDGKILIYSISNDGTLVSSNSFTIPTPNNPYNIAIHPSGQYIYIANYGSVIACAISAVDGNLSFLNRKNDTSNDIGGSICGIIIDPNGKYIYTSAAGSLRLAFLGLLSNGELDLTNIQGYNENNPTGLVIIRKKVK